MEITKDNLGLAIIGLRQCAKEHERDITSTGRIIVSTMCRDVANYLERIQGASEPMHTPVNPWHKASEELPEENSTVLGVGISGYPYICRYMYGHWFSEDNLTEKITITHWMEIPGIKED